MEVDAISQSDREVLLTTFRLFRTHGPENDYRGYNHRDVIEYKLLHGGSFDEEELYLLYVSVVNELSDENVINHLSLLLRQDNK